MKENRIIKRRQRYRKGVVEAEEDLDGHADETGARASPRRFSYKKTHQ